jgi:transcriptional regulator with XRE-family HTH domain
MMALSARSLVAQRLKEARLRAGISQKELGIRAGMDAFGASARINQYERAKHMPDVTTAARLCRVLAVPTPYLYAEDDALAAWILVFGRLSPAARRVIARKAKRAS